MPMIRLQQGEDWQERFAKEYGNRRRIGFLPGLVIGGLITMCSIYWLIPAVSGVDLNNLFVIGGGG
jgi:tetrahydromethanopterin S-methyltransferase subunit G